MNLNVNGVEVELSEDGVSSNGRARYAAKVSIAGVGDAFIKVYSSAPEKKVATAKPPQVRKAKEANGVAGLLAGLSPEQLAKLEAIAANIAKAGEKKA